MVKRTFEILDEQIIRRPALSRQDIARRLDRRLPEEVARDQDVEPLLRISKPELLSRLAIEEKRGRVSAQLRRSIEKILIRMSSRPTPNRCLAGLGILSEGTTTATRFVTLPPVPKLSRYALNRTLQFRGAHAQLSTSRGQEVLLLRPQLRKSLERLPKTFRFTEFHALFDKSRSSPRAARRALKQLLALEVIVPARERSLFQPRTGQRDGKEQALVFSASHPRLPRPDCQRLFTVATELLEMRHALWRRWARRSLWSLAVEFLNQHYDHGPVAIQELSEKLLLSRGEVSYQLEDNPFDDFLLSRAQFCAAQSLTWSISDGDWQRLKQLAAHAPLPISALAIGVFTSDTGRFKQLIGATAGSATRLFGRFGDHDESIAVLIKKIQQHELRNSRERCAEVEVHTGDEAQDFLLRRHSQADCCIELSAAHLGRVQGLKLDELVFVKSVEGEWTLMDRELKECILPYYTHSVTPTFLRNFHYSLLESYARRQAAQSYTWNWGKARSLAFLPRVIRNDTILSLARWRLARQSDSTQSVESFLNDLSPSLPELLFVTDTDKRLPLKRDSALFREILEERWSRGDDVLVEEDLSAGDELHELIVVGLRDTDAPPAARAALSNLRRGSAYLNFRIFLNPTSLVDLYECLRSFLQSTNSKDACFFIVYHRPNFHVRLRFSPRLGTARVVEFLQTLLEAQSIHSYSTHTYGPELDRWQGPKGLALYEKLSCLDSARVLEQAFAIESVPLAVSFWLDFFFSTADERVAYLRELVASMQVGPTTPTGARLKSLSGPLPRRATLTQPQRALRERTRRFLQTLATTARRDWISSVLHLSLNRTGLVVEASEEKAAYQLVLRRLMEQT